MQRIAGGILRTCLAVLIGAAAGAASAQDVPTSLANTVFLVAEGDDLLGIVADALDAQSPEVRTTVQIAEGDYPVAGTITIPADSNFRLLGTGRAWQVVLEGDGTSIDLLKEADVERADWVVAVTGRDEENLVACELAQTLGARRTIARLNDPRNRATFDALGIPVVAVTDLIGEVIEREVDVVELQRLAIIGRGRISLIEVEIPEGVSPQAVADLNLPPQTILVGVARDDRMVVPGAGTVIQPGDRVTAVTAVDQEPEVRWALCGVDRGPDDG